MKNSSNDTKKIIGALLVGTAVGAAIGILFAPEKGSETRKDISDKGEDFTDAIQDKFNDFLEGLKKEYEMVKEKAVTHFSENVNFKKESVRAGMDGEGKVK